MCVAIAKKIGAEVSDQVLKNCLRFNKDGFGVAYLAPKKKGNTIMIFKSLNFNTFKTRLRELEELFPDSPMLIHFRAMSKGGITMENCHPFAVDAKHVFIHNGTIGKAPADPKGYKSDTVMFNETIMQNLPKGWWGNPAMQTLIEEYIVLSKLAMMNDVGDFQFFNEKKGTWDGDVWYSNDQFLTPPEPKKKKHVHHTQSHLPLTDQNRRANINYGNADEYGEDVDYDLFSNVCEAFHGQNRLDIKSNRYEKFDFHTKTWVALVIWDNKYLKNTYVPEAHMTSKGRKGERVHGFAMTMTEVNKAAKEAGVSNKISDFTLKCTDHEGKVQDMSFTRCEFCWKPDYTDSLFISEMVDDADEVAYLMCDECHHNLKTHGALKEDN